MQKNAGGGHHNSFREEEGMSSSTSRTRAALPVKSNVPPSARFMTSKGNPNHSTSSEWTARRMEELTEGEDLSPTTVMDPLAVLRRCIRYFHLHPEMYGTDIDVLLEKELLHVLQSDAAESAFINLAPSSSPPLPPLQARSLPSSARRTYGSGKDRSKTGKLGGSTRSPEPLFTGTNNITLLHPGPGFFSLVEKAKNYQAGGGGMSMAMAGNSLRSTPIPEPAGWEGTLTPGQRLLEGEGTLPPDRRPRDLLGDSIDLAEEASTHSPLVKETTASSALNEDPTAPVVVVDGGGYEISFLRGQLQQMEAAYNSKCVKVHELVEENEQLQSQLRNAETLSKERLQELTTISNKMEGMRREVDTLREKVSEQSNQRQTEMKKAKLSAVQSGETSEVKQELLKMSELWRETEKALQECRRSLENAEKEANQSHDHLQDAFKYIERLERRVARRSRYISLSAKRQQSLEEKYEKLMWCYEELSCLCGTHSYADYLLAHHPIWSLFLFSRLQRHALNFSTVTMRSENPESEGIQFIQTPSGGKLTLKAYDPSLIYRTMVDEVLPIADTKSKQLRLNLLGSVGCRSVRPFSLYTIDYLGGEDKNPNSGELGQKCLSLLTVASLLLPLRMVDPSNKLRITSKEEMEPLPNEARYDQTTLRYILRNFWTDRLERFKRHMNSLRDVAIQRFTSNGSDEVENELADMDSNTNTFLGALIAFLVRYTSDNPEEDRLSYVIRGINEPNNKDLLDKGRIFFASVTKVDATGAPVGSYDTFTELIPPKVREILYALYHYTMELKDTDADFRLFYLVSHQLIPEMVGINFFASIEAIRSDCQAHFKTTILHPKRAATDVVDFEEDSTSNALRRVVKLVDTTPVVGEGRTIEEDSDGEGYGSILYSTNNDNAEEEEEKAEDRGPTLTAEEKLVHNIRGYLERTKREGDKPLKEPNHPPMSVEKVEFPEEWERLNVEIAEALTPHSDLLSAFEKARGIDVKDDAVGLPEMRRKRVILREQVVPFLSAARGLLSVEAVLSIFKRHCFATYAVSCIGTPRFSLAETFMAPTSDKPEDYVDALRRVGQVEPTKEQLQRMQFALSLDFPASLVPYSKLFDVDTHTGASSHFYDEYLRLTLDLFQGQQQYLVGLVLSCCSSRHEHLLSEGAEECDGNVTLKALKNGFVTALQRCAVAPSQSLALVQHLINYDRILRVEDEVRYEQFSDAPFYINTPSDEALIDTPPVNQQWDLEDETQECSLLNLSCAVRMSFIVWGFEAKKSASRMQTEITTAFLTNLVHKTKRGHKTNAPLVNYIKLTVPSTLEERRHYAEREHVERLKEMYLVAAHQLANGGNGTSNPLRQTEQAMLPPPPPPPEGEEGGAEGEKKKVDEELSLAQGVYPNFTKLIQLFTEVGHSEEKETNQKKKKGTEGKEPSHPVEERRAMVDTNDPAFFTLARVLGLTTETPPVQKSKKKKTKTKAVSSENGILVKLSQQNAKDRLPPVTAFVTEVLQPLQTKMNHLEPVEEEKEVVDGKKTALHGLRNGD